MNPRLIVLSGKNKGLEYEIVFPKVVIGRDKSDSPDFFDVFIDPLVSRSHFQITSDGDRFLLRDTNSRNGTFVNGSLVKEEIELKHKDEIRIGNTWLLFALHAVGDDELRLDAPRMLFLNDEQHTQSIVFIKSQESLYLNPAKSSNTTTSPRAEQGYRMLVQLGKDINSIRNSDELQERLLELLFTVIPAERGAVLTTGFGEGRFASRVVRFQSQQTEGQEWVVSSTILNQAKKEDGGAIAIQIDPEAQDVQKSLVSSGAKSVLAARLATVSEVFGVVYLDTTSAVKSFDQNHLELLIACANLAAGALDTLQYLERADQDRKRLQDELNADRTMIGDGKAMKTIRDWITRVASSDSTVLIQGESGTGKELVARAIHNGSERKDKNFIAINCAAIPDDLIESELFGYEKGAFTGALSKKKPGKFELADGGTIFLDEVGELSPGAQAKLLRVLQEREVDLVGGGKPLKVDVRVIAATNKDLEAAIKTKEFRADLFYRLNVLEIALPPLRERPDDIVQLANHFVAKHAAKCKRRIKGISGRAMERLLNHDWEGNVRELENAIERAVVMANTDMIMPEDLRDNVPVYAPNTNGSNSGSQISVFPASILPSDFPVMTWDDALIEAKKQIVLKTLEHAKGNRIEAAKLLDIHPNNLDRHLRQLGLRSKQKDKNEQEKK